MLEPHHFSYYGFDPEIDFFQVLGEMRRHKREASSSIDSIHFKLQKPISEDDHHHRRPALQEAERWLNALYFFRSRWAPPTRRATATAFHREEPSSLYSSYSHGSALAFRASTSSLVYLAESRDDF